MSGARGPRRHFTLTIEPDLAGQLEEYMITHGIVSHSMAVGTLLRMSFAASPEHGTISADRARAFNEVRAWTITEVQRAFREISGLLNSKI